MKALFGEEALATADELPEDRRVRAAREEAKNKVKPEMAMRRRKARSVLVHFADQGAGRISGETQTPAGTKTVYPQSGSTLRAYLGIDSGSTTTKFVLLDENENFWIPLCAESRRSADGGKESIDCDAGKVCVHGVRLEILAAGTTGYGEKCCFHVHFHYRDTRFAVETVAHARAAAKYTPDATFLLDIGGQDMKAIWLDNGVITNIVVNEACSSGCGSF